MAPVFEKFSNELNRIKLLLNNQLDSDYRKLVWSPFVCGDVESVKVQTVPKNTKKNTRGYGSIGPSIGIVMGVSDMLHIAILGPIDQADRLTDSTFSDLQTKRDQTDVV